MKKLLLAFIIIAALYFGWNRLDRPNDSAGYLGQSNDALFSSFDERNSGNQVEGNGVVIRILTRL